MLLLVGLFYLGVIVFMFASMWKLFEKAEQPGWAAIIPIYNTYIMLKIGGKPGWWLLLMFIPILAFGDARYLGPYGDPEEWNARRNRENFEFEHQDNQNQLH